MEPWKWKGPLPAYRGCMASALSHPLILEYPLMSQGGETFSILTAMGVVAFWGELEKLLTRALEYAHGEMLPEDLRPTLFFVLRGQDRRIKLAICVEKVRYSRFECVRIVALAGKGLLARPWIYEAFLNWAKATGARYVEGFARPAVFRLWRIAFKAQYVYSLVRKEL